MMILTNGQAQQVIQSDAILNYHGTENTKHLQAMHDAARVCEAALAITQEYPAINGQIAIPTEIVLRLGESLI